MTVIGSSKFQVKLVVDVLVNLFFFHTTLNEGRYSRIWLIQVENDGTLCRKQLIERNNELHPLEGSGDIKTIKSSKNIETNSLPLQVKRKTLDCSPVSEKGSFRYLSTEHSGSTLGAESGHGRSLLADSPNNQMAPSHSPTPASSPLSPSHGPTPASPPLSPSHGPTPASSPPSPSPPTPTPKKDLPLPPDMFAPLPPSPPMPRSLPKNSLPKLQTPVTPPTSNDEKKKQTTILAAALSGVVILIGLALCYREARSNKTDSDDRPLLVLTSNDYPGGMLMFFFLHDFCYVMTSIVVFVEIDKLINRDSL